MALKYKKIETIHVSLNDGLDFTELLQFSQNSDFNDGFGKTVNLNILANEDTFVRGAVITTKRTGIPPKHNPNNKVFSALPIDEEDGEGLGYSNVFIFDKRAKVLMYEFNRNGCYLSLFAKMIKRFSQDSVDEPIDIEFSPVLRTEAYERMLSMQVYKTLEVKIANPSSLTRDFLDENDALSNAIQSGSELESDTMDIKYSMNGRRVDNGMPTQVITGLINKVRRMVGIDRDLIKKFTIKGYRVDDSDSSAIIRDEIDILLDRYSKSFSVDEPNVQGDPQTREKSSSLLSKYMSCRSDFRIFY